MTIDYAHKMIRRSESHTKENIPELSQSMTIYISFKVIM
jgi:hypothetical protein